MSAWGGGCGSGVLRSHAIRCSWFISLSMPVGRQLKQLDELVRHVFVDGSAQWWNKLWLQQDSHGAARQRHEGPSGSWLSQKRCCQSWA
eukprot:8892340-Prorocentrum_lima.AAC.1